MKGWRVAMVLSFLLLSGCLVTFKQPLPADQAAPAALLGKWTSKDAWGESLNLEIKPAGSNRYRAISYPKGKPGQRDEYLFSVARHGSRWYLSAPVPEKFGGHFTLAGFELTDKHELVVYNLDMDQLRQAQGAAALSWETVETQNGEGLLVTSEQKQVFAYLDDPANSDVFVEAARYQRAGQ